MAGLASLLCGAEFYPVVAQLSAENQRTARELLDSQSALIEALRKPEIELEGRISLRTAGLQREQTRTKQLPYDIPPMKAADELFATGRLRSVRDESLITLFTDFSQFTRAVSAMPADRMVAGLGERFEAFDNITDACGVEKIRTTGGSCMTAAGLPQPCHDRSLQACRARNRRDTGPGPASLQFRSSDFKPNRQ